FSGRQSPHGRVARQGGDQARRSSRGHQPRGGQAREALAGGVLSRPRRSARHRGGGAKPPALGGRPGAYGAPDRPPPPPPPPVPWPPPPPPRAPRAPPAPPPPR